MFVFIGVVTLIANYLNPAAPDITTGTNTTSSVSHETLNPGPVTTVTTVTPASVLTSYTLAQVALHANATSCWSAVNGGVYDLTAWIGQHPGGKQAILSICGKDGSAAFNDQHSGQRRPANELASFKIATLSN